MASLTKFLGNKFVVIVLAILIIWLFGLGDLIMGNPTVLIFGGLIFAVYLMWGK